MPQVLFPFRYNEIHDKKVRQEGWVPVNQTTWSKQRPFLLSYMIFFHYNLTDASSSSEWAVFEVVNKTTLAPGSALGLCMCACEHTHLWRSDLNVCGWVHPWYSDLNVCGWAHPWRSDLNEHAWAHPWCSDLNMCVWAHPWYFDLNVSEHTHSTLISMHVGEHNHDTLISICVCEHTHGALIPVSVSTPMMLCSQCVCMNTSMTLWSQCNFEERVTNDADRCLLILLPHQINLFLQSKWC